jgi:hypothetical protein
VELDRVLAEGATANSVVPNVRESTTLKLRARN